MSPAELTAEQRETVRELQAELRSLDLQSDIAWAKYVHTNDEDCYNEALRLEGEREMKGLIAYIPKAGERKISKIRGLVSKIKGTDGQPCDGCDLGRDEARLAGLESVNAWRAEYELPPLDRLPKGMPGNAEECTLAMAFRTSLEELGVDDPEIDVSAWNQIHLRGYDKAGEYFSEDPVLDPRAGDLISDFDDNAWLDLLTDASLEGYAENVADEENWDRLQEISDEYALREKTHTLFEGMVLGLGAPRVRQQAGALIAAED